MAAQATREERREGADFVIDNSADRAHLVAEVDRVWAPLRSGTSARRPTRPATDADLRPRRPRSGRSHPPGTIGRCPVSRS